MEPQTAINTATPANTAPVKAAVICLILAWIFALLPIPLISMMGMTVMNVAALILAVICMSKSAVKQGVGILAGSLVGTPIMYFLGLALMSAGILSAGVASAITDHSNRTAQSTQPKQQPKTIPQETANAPSGAKELAGKWKGQFTYKNGAKADFTMTLANPNGSLINGDMSEIDPNTKQSISSVISGNVSQDAVSFKQVYSGQPEVTCSGKYSKISNQITGQCSVSNMSADFTAKKETGWL